MEEVLVIASNSVDPTIPALTGLCVMIVGFALIYFLGSFNKK